MSTTTTYTLTLAGWQFALIVGAVIGAVWAFRSWRAGARISQFITKR